MGGSVCRKAGDGLHCAMHIVAARFVILSEAQRSRKIYLNPHRPRRYLIFAI